MKYKLTIDPSLHNTSVGSPLSKDLKVEQPVCLILCSPRSRSPDSLFVLCEINTSSKSKLRGNTFSIMYLQSVTVALVAVLTVCAVGQTGQPTATSISATTTTSQGHFDAATSLGGVLAGEISSYFAQLLPSATSPPTPVEINEPLDIIIDGRIYPPVIYDGSVPM